MNLSESIVPRSDQLNADDLISGSRLVTVVDVKRGTAEQPVNIVTEEFGAGRPYKPSKSMRRVIVSAWGPDSTVYEGRQMVLFRNPSIRFGADEVGGIQISHMSHLSTPMRIPLTVTRGRRVPFTVEPLGGEGGPVDESGRDWLAELELAIPEGRDAVLALGKAARAANAGVGVLNVMTRAYNQFPKEQQ